MNVLIYRLPKNLSILGRSFCPYCKKPIGWYDNIPFVSFVMLGGKCRNCYSPILIQYPLVELLTGGLFVFVFLLLGIRNQGSGIVDLINLGYYLFIVSALLVVFFIDLRHGIIPDKIIFPSILISAIYLFLIHNPALPAGRPLFMVHLLSAFGSFGFFLLLYLITRGRGMGFGDVKLSFLMGLFLGFPKIVIALYIAFLTGAAVSLILVLWGKKKFFGGTVPFGPFLVLGTIISAFWGNLILAVGLRWLNF